MLILPAINENRDALRRRLARLLIRHCSVDHVMSGRQLNRLGIENAVAFHLCRVSTPYFTGQLPAYFSYDRSVRVMDEGDQSGLGMKFASLFIEHRLQSGQGNFEGHHVFNPIFLRPELQSRYLVGKLNGRRLRIP